MDNVAKDDLVRQPQLVNRSVQDYAWQFHRAADTLSDNGFDGAPVIVTAAFALELYLKSLNADFVFPTSADLRAQVYLYGTVYDQARDQAQKAQHEPSLLFAALSKELQDHLANRYLMFPELADTAASVQEALSLFDKAFVQWRYAFEGNARAVKVAFLLELLEFFRGTVNDLGPRGDAP